MKKTYTKKQITEAIRYWERQLRKMNESAETIRQGLFNEANDTGFLNTAKYDDMIEDLRNLPADRIKSIRQKYERDPNLTLDDIDEYGPYTDDFFRDFDEIFCLVFEDGFDVWNSDLDTSFMIEDVQGTILELVKAAVSGKPTDYAQRIIDRLLEDIPAVVGDMQTKLHQNWRNRVEIVRRYYTEFFKALRQRFQSKTFEIKYEYWHREKAYYEIEADSEEDAVGKFNSEMNDKDPTYDKDFEIVGVRAK